MAGPSNSAIGGRPSRGNPSYELASKELADGADTGFRAALTGVPGSMCRNGYDTPLQTKRVLPSKTHSVALILQRLPTLFDTPHST